MFHFSSRRVLFVSFSHPFTQRTFIKHLLCYTGFGSRAQCWIIKTSRTSQPGVTWEGRLTCNLVDNDETCH